MNIVHKSISRKNLLSKMFGFISKENGGLELTENDQNEGILNENGGFELAKNDQIEGISKENGSLELTENDENEGIQKENGGLELTEFDQNERILVLLLGIASIFLFNITTVVGIFSSDSFTYEEVIFLNKNYLQTKGKGDIKQQF